MDSSLSVKTSRSSDTLLVSSLFYAPGDWLSTCFTARQRRAAATWMLIVYVLTLPLRYPYRNTVSLVWYLSELALIVSLLSVVSAETPVEGESDE